MADRSVSVRLQADISNYVAGMTRAAGVTGLLQGATQSLLTGQGALAVVAGGAVVGGLAAAAGAAMTFDKAMSGVQAATMASAGTMDALRQAALDAGADTSFSATEAADAITEMAKAGVSAQDIMRGGLSGALSLAAAGQLEVADAAEIAATALSVFGLSGSQMPHVADLLAAGAGKAQGSVSDLSAALNQSALVAKNTGLSIEDTTGALALFASNGLLGSDAGTSFKTMLMSLNPRSQEAATLMDQLGLRAYDAQGRFVGLQGYAGQLRTALSGMSAEQRNATLQTIFGSDAVRAATVLYQAGADGVRQWTDNVNDAGFAARQAAMLQDNLSGDLEKLGGAFDTLMISLGSGSQGPLREVVQALTGVVDVATGFIGVLEDIPGPVTTVAVAIGVLALANGPLSGAVGAMTTQLGSLREGVGTLGTRITGATTSTAGFRSAMSGLAGAISPASLAITGAVVLIPTFVSGLRSITGPSDQAASAAEQLASAIQAANGAINETTRAAAQQSIINSGLTDVFSAAGVSARDAIDGLLGNAAALDRVNDALAAYAATRGTAQQGDEMGEKTRIATNDYEELAAQYGITADQAEYFGDAAEGAAADQSQLAAETAGATDSMTEAARGATILSDRQQELADTTSAAKQQVDAIRLALEQLGGATVNTAELEAQYYNAIAQATGATKDLSGAVLSASGDFDRQTEAGRAAQDALFGIRDVGLNLISNQAQLGESTEQLTGRANDLRGQFIAAAQQMGINADEAGALADRYGLIPDQVITTVQANTASAAAGVNAVTDALARMPSVKTVRIITDASGATVGRDFSNGNDARAGGGPVTAGRTYLVGEEGPELVQFGASGFVTPADRTAAVLAAAADRQLAPVDLSVGGAVSSSSARTAIITLPGLAGGGPVAPRQTGWLTPAGPAARPSDDALLSRLIEAIASRPTIGTVEVQDAETAGELVQRLVFASRTV